MACFKAFGYSKKKKRHKEIMYGPFYGAQVTIFDHPKSPEFCWIYYQMELNDIGLKDVARKAGCTPELVWYAIHDEMWSPKVRAAVAELLGYPSWEELKKAAAINSHKDGGLEITGHQVPKYIPPALRGKEPVTPEMIGEFLRSGQPRFEYFDFPPSQGFWSKFPLRLRYARAKPLPAWCDLRPWLWEEHQKLREKRLAEGTRQETHEDLEDWADRHFDDLAKTHGYRRPWFVRQAGRKKHPTLARILCYFWYLPLKFDPPWKHLELIITRKNTEKKGAAA
jgi:hypothetical protein